MSNTNKSSEQQSPNDDKSVFSEQGRSKIASDVNQYGTDMTNNSANVENLCHGCNTGKCQNTVHKKATSSK